uniref:Uncharacterized protein n=1 Tax=Sphaerodactylus townsendi TaxID=933632 RepID=A0ACB8F1R1_9SAUR
MTLCLLLLCFFLARVPACSARPSHAHLSAGDSDHQRAEALKRLLQVFGIMEPPQSPHGIKRPPQYMVDLYNTVAGADGVTKDPDILEGNTVRSFLDKSTGGVQGQQLEVHACFGLQATQWNEVRDWTEEESSNRGLLLTVQGLGGAVLEPGAVQFASGRDHHESKKPMLVLFTDDGRRGAALPINAFSGEEATRTEPGVIRV